MAGELVLQRVRVEGDELDVVPEGQLVSLRRACEVFGLVLAGQIKKLRAKSWARVAEKYTRDSAGRVQKAILIDLNTFHGWLLNTESRKVKSQHRAKLEAYQNNALSILTAYFSGQPAPHPVLPWGHRFRQTFGPHLRYMGANHPGSFSIYSGLASDFMHAEEVLNEAHIVTSPDDRPDVSAGLLWAADRRRRNLPDATVKAPLFLPSQQFEVSVNVFDGSEWKAFAEWFRAHYIPEKFVAYLLRKAEWRDTPKQLRTAAADAVSLAVVGRHAKLPAPRRRALATNSKQGVLFGA